MKNFLLICIFYNILSNSYAQSPIFPPINRYKYDTMVVDSGNIRISYAMNALDINDAKTYDDIQRLEIGSNLSKYYSYYYYNDDSLKKESIKKQLRNCYEII